MYLTHFLNIGVSAQRGSMVYPDYLWERRVIYGVVTELLADNRLFNQSVVSLIFISKSA